MMAASFEWAGMGTYALNGLYVNCAVAPPFPGGGTPGFFTGRS